MDAHHPLREVLDRFEQNPMVTGESSNNVKAHTRDIRLFGEWFLNTTG